MSEYINQHELKSLVSYDKNTGVFTVTGIIKHSSKKIGDILSSTNNRGYLRVFIKNRTYTLHRLAFLYMTGKFPINDVDHINHVKNDNRWVNLRDVMQKDNAKNRPLPKNNKSGAVGVDLNEKKRRWSARISVNKKRVFLGLFKNLDDAIASRRSAEIRYGFHENHGAFKCL